MLLGDAARCMAAWLFVVLLVFGLGLSPVAAALPSADDHARTSADASEGAGKAVPASLACHPGLVCEASTPRPLVSRFVSAVGQEVRPDVPRSQFRFRGPSVNLQPPRTLT